MHDGVARKRAGDFAMLMAAHTVGNQPQAEFSVGVVRIFVVLAPQANVRTVPKFNHALTGWFRSPLAIAAAPRFGTAVRGVHSMPCAWQRMQAAVPRMWPAAACSELDPDAEGEAILVRTGVSDQVLP